MSSNPATALTEAVLAEDEDTLTKMADSNNPDDRKRQYADENGTYVLPNEYPPLPHPIPSHHPYPLPLTPPLPPSAPEHDRLDAQSRVLITMMHNRPFHAPLAAPRPKRILDVGCGTGAMTFLLASAVPDAEVVGVDISPVPERHDRLPNLRYVQGNVMDLVGTRAGAVDFSAGTFDYVFHRLLVLGMTDWRGYVRSVMRLLRPGGWVEMQDYDLSIYDAAGENLTDGWWHWSAFREDAAALGLDVDVGRKLGGLMREAGLEGVEEKMYEVPCADSEDLPEHLRPVGRHMGGMIFQDGYIRALMTRVSRGRRSEEELERMILAGHEKYKGIQPGYHALMGVAWGRKAG